MKSYHIIIIQRTQGEHEKIAAFNLALKKCADSDDDILLIEKDLLSNIEDEYALAAQLQEALYYTEKHAFASPRIEVADNPKYYAEKLESLPPFSITLEPDIRCVCIKNRIIKLVVTANDCYNTFYFALLDFAQRANELGFSSVRSNRAFVNASLSYLGTLSDIEKNDEKRLLEKYPYYPVIKEKQASLTMHPFDRFITLFSKSDRKRKILFNLHDIRLGYDGTTELSLSILDSFYSQFKDKHDISILTTQKADDFHKLSEKFPNMLYPDTISGVFDIGFCPNQLYHLSDHIIMNRHCLKSVYALLDIIALRCNYISDILPNPFEYAKCGTLLCDGIVTISDYSKTDSTDFFINSENLQNKPIKRIYISTKEAIPIETQYDLQFDEYFLVVGNHFKHKALSQAIEVISDTDLNFIMIGGDKGGFINSNIYNYPSGQLEDDFVSYLYLNCKALIFPSVYEGFGIPVATALKMGKHVILYNNEINNELLEHFSVYKEYFHFFDRFSQINDILKSIDYRETTISPEHSCSWDDVALEIEAFFEDILEAETSFAKRMESDYIISLLEKREELYRSLEESNYHLGERDKLLKARNEYILKLEVRVRELAEAFHVTTEELTFVKSRLNYKIASGIKAMMRKILPWARPVVSKLRMIYQRFSQRNMYGRGTSSRKLAFFTPLPPLKTGIADYSADILNEISRYFDIDVFVDEGYTPNPCTADNIRILPLSEFKRENYLNVVYQMGDAPYHKYMIPYFMEHPGILVLHDQDETSRNLAVNSTNRIIVHSNKAGHELNALNPKLQVITIPHYATIEPLPNEIEAKEKCSFKPDDVVIASFGFMATRKRTMQVAKAFLACLKKHPNLHLLFVGGNYDAPIDEILEEFDRNNASDRLTITDYLDSIEAFCDYIDAGDICVNLRYPEFGESSGSLARFLAKGKAIIVNDIGSFAELPDDCCIKLPPPIDMNETEEIESIKNAMLSLIEDKEQRMRLKENARKYAESNLNIKTIGKQYADFIHD